MWGTVRGALGAGRDCRYSGASIGIGGIRGLMECKGHWEPSGDWDCQGVSGCIWGWQVV